jgi:hypothetical protein
MASAALTASHQDLASFIKNNHPCDSQGMEYSTSSPPSSPPSSIEDTPSSYYRRSYCRTLRNNTTIICADPRITEDLFTLLKEATSEEQARVEKIEVHEIFI